MMTYLTKTVVINSYDYEEDSSETEGKGQVYKTVIVRRMLDVDIPGKREAW